MRNTEIEAELQRRNRMWGQLLSAGGPSNVRAELLRELGIYGGASGNWDNKGVTASLTAEGHGVAVSVLHNGSSYADDLTDDGLIYHFPNTRRLGNRD